MNPQELITRTDLQQLETRLHLFIQECIPPGFIPGQKWLRSRDMKRWLGVSPSTLYNMRQSGSIPFTKLGDTYLYPYQEVKKILESRVQVEESLPEHFG